MNNKGLLIVISGPSGVGKGTIVKELTTKLPAKLSISATTRAKRDNEVDGQDYYFLTQEQFETRIKEQSLLEYAIYNNNYYGTPREQVLYELNNNHNIIVEIEVNGAKQIKKSYPEAILIYILPPTMAELKARLKKRGTETPDQIEQRLNIAYQEINQVDLYDHAIINDNLDRTTNKIITIIRKYQKQSINN